MKLIIQQSLLIIISVLQLSAQSDPVITAWLQNDSETGTYYVAGNSTVIDNNILYNCQLIEFSEEFVYVHTTGIPSFPTGPFLDGNPSQASDQEAIYKIPRFPQPAVNAQSTNGGNVGIFVNGVSLFDFRDGVGWNSNTQSLCGGPGNSPCPGGPMAQTDWSRDAVPAEKDGFDCSKAHPAMGNYHHHQNPSAFKLDVEVVSDICNLYDAEGLYAINEEEHSPLIGYAYDGYPIYGAYGYANADGSGGITRIKSGYQLRNITERSTHADGSNVDLGPNVEDYFLGYFREDYEWLAHEGEDEYLDIHNGRFSVTPEYPQGTYAYYSTVDENWNSTYPYVIGPTFYGEVLASKINMVTEDTENYNPAVAVSDTEFEQLDIQIFPNPSVDLIAIQIKGLVSDDYKVDLIDINGVLVSTTKIARGSTIAFFDVEDMYAGTYIIAISNGDHLRTEKVVIGK